MGEYDNTANTVRVEVVFFKNSRDIEFNDISAKPGGGESATIGIQKGSTGPYAEWSFEDVGSVFDGERLTFVPTS